MKKINVVKKRYEFEKIIQTGNIVKNKYYVIYYKENNLNRYRFGISVGKKLGNAVFRNKYKRKIRSIVDNYKKNYQNNEDYIIIMRKACIDLNYEIMDQKFHDLINEITKRRNNEIK